MLLSGQSVHYAFDAHLHKIDQFVCLHWCVNGLGQLGQAGQPKTTNLKRTGMGGRGGGAYERMFKNLTPCFVDMVNQF